MNTDERRWMQMDADRYLCSYANKLVLAKVAEGEFLVTFLLSVFAYCLQSIGKDIQLISFRKWM